MPDRRAKSTRLHRYSRDHQDGARRQAHQTFGGAADDLFIEPGMSHEADDEQIEVMLVDECDDGLDRVARKQMGLECTPAACACTRAASISGTERRLASIFLLVDLVDAGRKPRQLLRPSPCGGLLRPASPR